MNNNNFDEIINSLKGKNSKKEAEDFLMQKLNPAQSKKLQEIMKDKDAMSQFLSTPQARNLLKKLTEENNE